MLFFAIPHQAKAANGSINITSNQNSIYIATDNVSGSSFDTFTATSNSSTFKKDLIGTQTKNVTNQILNFGGGTAQNDVIGLNRVRNGGNITQTNTLNISGGTIEGNILATADSGNYNGTSRRTSNNVNISGGTIKGNVEGGAGATNNTITITGGTFAPSNNSGDDGCGDQTLGAIYAGVSDSSTSNKSTNGTVILKNMAGTNSFLNSFVEGTDGVSGTIFGSNLSGTSNMQFENVKGTYSGGLRNFDNVSVDANSQVTLGGKSYYGDNWTINGTLNTNSKTIHAYKNPTINLTVNSTGTLSQQFLSDANVNALNQGNINGISTSKNTTLLNSGNMTGNYSGASVNITNSGIMNSLAGQTTSISSSNAGILNNNGQIKENLTLSGALTLNNNVNGIIKAQIKNNQTLLNINNTGTINSTTLTTNGNNQINISNNADGTITNSLSLVNGTLNLTNNTGGNLVSNSFTANNGSLNIANSGAMSGNQSFTALNSGVINFTNNATGAVSGNLNINSGLGTFANNGTFQNLNINNLQDNNFQNENSGSVINTTFIADNSNLEIENSGVFSGLNNFSSLNGGSFTFSNANTGK